MREKLKSKNEGFTIIEVLIVLAIAGLIMLIVFLAVPALQRNSRNSSRRADIGKMLSLVTEYGSSNNGNLPTTAGCTGTDMSLGGGTGTQSVLAPGAYYCKTTGTSVTWPAGTGALTNTTTTDSVALRSGATCDGTTGNAVAGSARSVVALFTLEIGTKQCQAT